METTKAFYNTVFYERADQRVKDWLLMTSPWPLVAIIAVYLTVIKLVLPKYMQDRKPFNLRTAIKWYNILQIVSNAVITYGILTSGWTTTYHFGCMLPDYSLKAEPMRMLRFLWWTIIIKILEFVETVFFILRKRNRQASFLHVYHHISSFIMIWAGVKYVGVVDVCFIQNECNYSQLKFLLLLPFLLPTSTITIGGITSFSPMLNNSVHVIMYSYYLFSAEGSPAVKAVLAKYKKWLTVMQMVQFTVMIVYSAQVFLPSCPAPLGLTYMYFPNVVFVYYMFYKFFKQNYVNSKQKL